MKNYLIILLLINISWAGKIPKYYEPEYYSIISIRNYTLSESIPFSFWNEHIDLQYLYHLHDVKPKDKTWVFTFGYRKPFKNINYQKEYIPFHNYFFGFEFEGLNWYEYDDYDGSMTWMNWSVGYGIGIKNYKRFQINLSAQYNIFTGVDYYDYGHSFELGANNYLSFNLGIGFNTYGKSKWSQFGLHFNKPTGKHYINADLPIMDATEIGIEINPILSGGGLLIIGAIWALAQSGGDADDILPTSSSSSKKGCHVYGNIKFVQFGEDYKVKFVSFGADLKIKYVSFGADSPGEWKVVEFGEDYKIKVVEFGADFTVQEVSFGEGCN